MNKLKDKRGETLIESLVSVLIAALAFAFLATAAVSAEKINAKTRNTDISFRYTTVGTAGAADEKTTSEAAATVKLTDSGTLTSSGSVHDAKNSVIIFFTVSSCLLLGSKLQCAVFTPFLIIAVLYVGFKSNKRNLCIVCSIVLLWHGVGGYVINGGQLNLDTQYNSVFYGILKDSPNPKQDLIDMGLDEDMAADSGKHAYLDKSEYKYPPRSDIMNEKFHSKMSNGKLIKFYITHPLRLVSVMETTAQNAFTNKINLGTFEKKYGYAPNTSSYRFDLWENIREHLPKTLFFIIPSYTVFLLIGIVMLKKKNRYAVPFIFVILMGLIQFPMPYIGNGAADISKQLFLFNISFDFGLTVLIYMLFKTVSKKLSKKISKNS